LQSDNLDLFAGAAALGKRKRIAALACPSIALAKAGGGDGKELP